MKQLKLSWLYLFSALIISGGVLVGCQKDVKDPSLTSGAAKIKEPTTPVTGPNWGSFQIEITTPGIGCPGQPFSVGGMLVGTIGESGNKVFIITPLGTNVVDNTDDGAPILFQNEVIASEEFTYTEPGTYYFKVEFDVNDNSVNNPTVSTITSVVVNAINCGVDPEVDPCSVSLTARRVLIAVDANAVPTGTYAVEFNVVKSGACPLPTDYKLQGGLTSGTVVEVNGTTVASSGTGQYKTLDGVQGFLRKATGNLTNSSINWVNNPVLQTGNNYFWVEFTKPTKSTDPYLTGSWSIKGTGFADFYADRVKVY